MPERQHKRGLIGRSQSALLLYVFESRVIRDSHDSANVNIESGGKLIECMSFLLASFPYELDIPIRELSPISLLTATFCEAVLTIFCKSAKPQVVRIDAIPIIALMKNKQITWIFIVCDEPHDSTSHKILTRNCEAR